MMLPTLLSIGTFALSAQAFLLPLDFAETAEVAKSLKPFVSQSKEVDLDCSTCPFALQSTRHGLHEWTNSQKSDLKLKFSTANNKLSLNGVPFYPTAFPDLPPVLAVKQVAKKDGGEASTKEWEAYSGDLKLSYSLEIDNVKHFANPDEPEADLVSIVISIMGLDDQMVQVDDIQIRLLKEANSALHIIDIDTVPAPRTGSKCTTVMCRFFAKITANMGTAKSAAQSAAHKIGQKVKMCCIRCMSFFRGANRHRMHHGKHHGMNHGMNHGKHHSAHLPTYMRPKVGSTAPHEQLTSESPVATPEEYDPHHTQHAFMKGVMQAFSYVIFPVMVGIAFGVTASAVGMLVGQLVVFLWSKFRPSRQGTYEIVVDVDAKEDGLPAYEDVEEKSEL